MSEASALDPASPGADLTDAHVDEARLDGDAAAAIGARRSRRLAWTGWGAAIGMNLAGLALLAATGFREIPGSYGFPGFSAPFAFSFGTVGAFVLARRPGNVVGRVLLTTGLFGGFQTLYTGYAIYGGIAYPDSLPFWSLAAWLLSWAWIPFMFLATPLLISIFPDGRVVSPRWGLVLAVALVASALLTVTNALRAGPIENFKLIDNPFGLLSRSIADLIAVLGFVALSASIVAAAASMVVRYRRAEQDRRQQIKWFAVAGVLIAVATPMGFVAGKPGQAMFLGAVALLPVATGIAVLRYGLYDIDTIINRALVYGLLTAIIAGIYTASIGVMQRLSSTFLGGSSEATIVVTTVVIVTAFTPIKTRLQALVDRRFKDAGDAKSVVEPFTKELHDRTWALDPRQVLRRFAEVLVAALRAAKVEVRQERGTAPTLAGIATGTSVPSGLWSTESTAGAVTLRLSVTLGPHGISPRDQEAVTQALAAVAAELGAD